VTILGNRFARSLEGVGVALLLARASAAQSRACNPVRIDSTAPSSARWSAPLDRTVTVRATGLSLRDALDRVAAIAKLRLSYSPEVLQLDRAVCLSADAEPAGKVLAELMAGTNVIAVPAGGDQVALTPRAPAPQVPDTPEMARSLGMLDRVVVTGSATGAPERELTVGLNVLNGRQLSRENTGTLSGALDSYVPGMWSWAQSPSSVLSSYASIRGASSFGLSYPKIYIDGIEVANPLLVSRFAPDAIDRIEVIRGPQGSALYGTDAISGVVNIVTRHDGLGVDGERASVRTTAGVMQSAFSHNVLSQEHALSLVAGSSTSSADLHVSGGTTGAFIPNAFSRDLLANGSARRVGERSTLSATARFFVQEAGSTTSPLVTRTPTTPTGIAPQATAPQSVREYTVGTTATIAQSEHWTHSIVAGIDGYRLANVESSFTPIPRVADSALQAAQGHADRATIRGSSVLHLRPMEPTRLTLTMSAEHSTLREVADSIPRLAPQGKNAVTRADPRKVVNWQSSTGVTAQASAAVNNSLFLTGGVRVEHDSRLASNDDIATLPMLGVATVGEIGPFSVKLRGAYGEGIRPPSTLGHASFWQSPGGSSPQATLGPERQSGIEAGIDLSLQRALSLKITHFNQRASGLIQQVVVAADDDYQSHRWMYALENVGEITNRGWELEATTGISRLSVSGTMSFVDSRVHKLAPGYNGDLATNDRMLQVPARTGSLNLSWLGRRWYASLGGSRAFDWINYDELGLAQAFMGGTHPARELIGPQLRQYWRQYNGALRVRASASRDILDRLAFEITGENLLSHQLNEPDNMTVLPGRTIMTGVHVKF
jgi:outer membrane receptor protein involved in Fe transport